MKPRLAGPLGAGPQEPGWRAEAAAAWSGIAHSTDSVRGGDHSYNWDGTDI